MGHYVPETEFPWLTVPKWAHLAEDLSPAWQIGKKKKKDRTFKPSVKKTPLGLCSQAQFSLTRPVKYDHN